MRRMVLALAAAILLAAPLQAAERPLTDLVSGLAKHQQEGAARARQSNPSYPVIVTLNLFAASKYADDMAKQDARTLAKSAVKSALSSFLQSRLPGKAARMMTTAPRFAAKLSEAEIRKLAADPTVARMEYDAPAYPLLRKSLPFIQMDKVFAAGGTGLYGTVVVIDTGDDPTHPFINKGMLRLDKLSACFRNEAPFCANGEISQTGAGSATAVGGQIHGTHVAGIVAGYNKTATASQPKQGVAPYAAYIPINIFRESNGTSDSDEEAAFEYVDELVSTNNNMYSIRAVNMSVGGGAFAGNCDSEMSGMKAIFDRLRKKGVAVVVAAGNAYQMDAVSAPACISSAIAVSAASKQAPLAISSYTNVGRMTDLYGPGGEFDDCVISSVPGRTYEAECGTSMASPHVAGAMEVLQTLYPKRSVTEILQALRSTGRPVKDTRTGGHFTFPFIQVNSARQFLANPTADLNDSFAYARPVNANTWYYGSNVFASNEAGERYHAVAGDSGSVWFKITAASTGRLHVTTTDSDFDTTLAVYASAARISALKAPLAVNDNARSGVKTSALTINAVKGATYYISVAGKTASERGRIVLVAGIEPVNDNFAKAQSIAGTQTRSAYNTFATLEDSEPTPVSESTKSVWWTFKPTSSSYYFINTFGSNVADTALAIYSGNSLSSLQEIESNDDIDDQSRQSGMFPYLTAGVTYHIQVMGYSDSDVGLLKLSVIE
ncbi:S8 family peptidase [Oryzibacter oryziterrae]|uniref:S8 family peptidase n=1 Tax=Oryzibacter oryziterrae TaxID=2766474 RepID=UPI001F007281|nr:S8 family serine peptidase [Oryzibacter oryziterrae]